MKSRSIAIKFPLLLCVVLSSMNVAQAALDKFDPYVYARAIHDTNLFRRDSDEEDDTIGYLGAGLKADWKLSRQHLLLDGVVARAVYDKNDQLDHTMIDITGTWAWEIGNLWDGQLGYRYEDRLSSFNQRLITDKDMRTTQTGFLNAGYQLHPDWRIVVGTELRDVSYQERKRLDRDTALGKLEVQYQNTLNTRIGVRGEYTKNDLNDQNINGIEIDNDYDIAELSGVFYWQGTAKSALEARLGYVDVSYNDIDDRDFQGVSYRLTYFWVHSEKTSVDVEAWREPSSLSDEITDYVLSQGFSIKPTWRATEKISLVGTLQYENDDFKARNDVVSALGAERRDDDIWLFRIAANWDPRQFLRLTLAYRKENRDSSINERDFDDNQYEIRALLKF